MRNVKATILILLTCSACSSSNTVQTIEEPSEGFTNVVTKDADGKVTGSVETTYKIAGDRKTITTSTSSQILTDHGTSAEAAQVGAKAASAEREKTSDEIRAEGEAKFVFWIGLIGAGMIIVAVVLVAIKVYAVGTGVGWLMRIVTLPTWVVGLIGLIGVGMFGWATLGAEKQELLAGVMVAGAVVIFWISWQTSHRQHVTIRKSTNGEHANADPSR